MTTKKNSKMIELAVKKYSDNFVINNSLVNNEDLTKNQFVDKLLKDSSNIKKNLDKVNILLGQVSSFIILIDTLLSYLESDDILQDFEIKNKLKNIVNFKFDNSGILLNTNINEIKFILENYTRNVVYEKVIKLRKDMIKIKLQVLNEIKISNALVSYINKITAEE
jgi:hypothetical protein